MSLLNAIQIQFLKLRLESMNSSNDLETEREAQPNPKRKQSSNEQRAAIVKALLERSTNKVLRSGAINEVARQFDVNRAAIRRVWSRAIESLNDGNVLMDGSSKKSNCGRKKRNLQLTLVAAQAEKLFRGGKGRKGGCGASKIPHDHVPNLGSLWDFNRKGVGKCLLEIISPIVG